jgi:signal transduction histidine kinase
MIHPEDLPLVEAAIARAIAGDGTMSVEYRYLLKDGQVRWSETRGRLYRDSASQPVRMIGVLQEITARKRAEQERRELLQQECAARTQAERTMEQLREAHERLHTLSKRLLEVQESERRHIARELHDQIGQALTAGIINLQIVQGSSDTLAGLPELQESVGLFEETLQQVRDMSLELRPSMLDDLGLVPALRWYLNRQAPRGGFTAKLLAGSVSERLPAEVETVCFRVAQEAVTNIVRHAHAKRVRVELTVTADEVHLRITDDGAGFDVALAHSRAAGGTSLGLLSMQERVALAGGRFSIDSNPGEGTSVAVVLPLPASHPPATPDVLAEATT